jgi:predicted regulator of Ras-like GTPase activity (Roadblock/LC7/MglB family)
LVSLEAAGTPSPNKAVREVLNELRSVGEIASAAVVSRSGMIIDGDAPSFIHMETFGAMMAIMLGAAETATAESQSSLRYINVELATSNLVILGAGQRVLLACLVKDRDKFAQVVPLIEEAARRLKTVV